MSDGMPLDSEVYYYTFDPDSTNPIVMEEASPYYYLSENPYTCNTAPPAYFEDSELAMPYITARKSDQHRTSENEVEQQNAQLASPSSSPVRRAIDLFMLLTFGVLYIFCASLFCFLERTD
jgi:hypothetical protein